MKDQVRRYSDEYTALLYRIEATDAQGNALSFDTGVARAIAMLRERSARGGKVMFVGNGGSAAIAGHFALDYWHAGGMRSIAFDDGAQLTCVSNDHGYEQVFAMPIEIFADAGDLLVAISSSGRSQNILNAVSAARRRDCAVITLSGFRPDNSLRVLGDVNFYVPVEVYGYVELLHDFVLHCILDLKVAADGS